MALKLQRKFEFSDFEVDAQERTLRRHGQPISVGSKTFDLLIYFLENPHRVVTKDELLDALWPNTHEEESNLNQHIYLLRKAITASVPGERIIVGAARGYQFAEAVTEIKPEPVVVSAGKGAGRDSERFGSRGGPFLDGPDDLGNFNGSAPLEVMVGAAGKKAAPEAEKPRLLRADAEDARADAEDRERRERVRERARERERLAQERDEEGDGPRSPALRFLSGFRHPGPTEVAVLTAVLVALAFSGWFAWRRMHRPHGDSLKIAMADFTNSTGNQDFDPALRTALAIDLQQSPYLSLDSGARVREALVAMRHPAGERLDAAAARGLCGQLGDQAYLTGGVSSFAHKYLLTVQVFACPGGESLAESRGIADSPDGVLGVMNRVAADVRLQLGEPQASVERFGKPLFAQGAGALAALKAYSSASRLGMEGKYSEAAPLFQRAIELDPKFAVAYADLGITYSNLGQHDLANSNLGKAYELRDTVDEEDKFFITALFNYQVTGDLSASLRNYQAWTQLYPRNPVALARLADMETQIGKAAQALEPARKAVELNPADAASYVILARAQMHVGQFEEAAATCRKAMTAHADDPAIHAFLFEIAFLRLDQPAMDEQLAWARQNGEEPELLLERGQMEFAIGKVKAAQATLSGVAEVDRKQGRTDRANRTMAAIPRAEAELGLGETALSHLVKLTAADGSAKALADGTADVPVAWAIVGETSRSEAILAREIAAHPADTLWHEDLGAQVRAAVALSQAKPQAAIDALQIALPYDLRGFALPAMRGRAYLLAKQPLMAEAEFHKILDHPGIEPVSYNYPLAQLGLARALVQDGKLEEAGFAYKVLFQIWKEADPDFPKLKAAQAEYGRLFTPAPKPAVSHPAVAHTSATAASKPKKK